MIKDLSEGKVTLTCLITKADIGKTQKNVPYLSLILEDSSGSLDAKFWNLTEEQAASYHAGDVVEVKGDLIYHRNAAQLRIRTMDQIDGADISQFVQQAPMSRSELESEIGKIVGRMKNPVIREITDELIRVNADDFYTFPAAVRNHHNFVGGLAYHSLSMAKTADFLIELYPFLDYDLLMAGILLHDMGKIEELSLPVLPEYTAAGNLLGHISMMNNQIDRVASALEQENSEEVMLLKHMVLSHHGKYEYGSPVLPMIPEAEVLTLLDNLDARMIMMKSSLEAVKPGCFGPRVFALDNRMLYRRKFNASDDALETHSEDEKNSLKKESEN